MVFDAVTNDSFNCILLKYKFYFCCIPQSLEETLKELTDKFNAAVSEKLFCQNQAGECAEKIDLADRLVNGLASENVRWKESVLM